MLLSKLGASLSNESRMYLESMGLKLTRFLASYQGEFTIHKSGDGRESVSHHEVNVATAMKIYEFESQ